MVYCSVCKADVDVDTLHGFTACVECGQALEAVAFSSDVNFVKGPGGQSSVEGNFVSDSGAARSGGRLTGGRFYGGQVDSHEKALARGRQEMVFLLGQLDIARELDVVEPAHRLYNLALNKNFTRGRRTNQVAAACMYLICRTQKLPYMLIDFSDALQVNVFVLGMVFQQLVKLLNMESNAMLARPIDPCLYVHRFAARLDFKERMWGVTQTALQLIKSMKRDWIQTGRRPAGVCGAALFIAAHVHGFERTKRDVIRVVHIGASTLAKRVNEFAGTSASEYTADDFEINARLLEDAQSNVLGQPQPVSALPAQGGAEGTAQQGAHCGHVGEGEPPEPPFAHGMCRACYVEFLQVAGSSDDAAANPPAFTRGVQKELAAQQAEEDELANEEEEILLLEESAADPGTAASAAADGDVDSEGADEASLEAAMNAALTTQELAQLQQALPPAARTEYTLDLSMAAQPAARKRKAGRPAGGLPPILEAEPDAHAAAQGTGQESCAAGSEAPLCPESGSGGEGADEDGDPAEGAARDAKRLRRQQQAAASSEGLDPSDSGRPDTSAAAGPQLDAQSGALALREPLQVPGDSEDEDLSELSDVEVSQYLLSAEESKMKETVWTQMNQDYLDAQAIKGAQQAAAAQADAEKRADASALDAEGQPKKRGRGRPLGSKTKPRPDDELGPADTPAEATRRMLSSKKLSSKINYDALNDLFDKHGSADRAITAVGEKATPRGVSAAGGGGARAVVKAGRANAATAASVMAALEKKQKVGRAMEQREAQRAAQAKEKADRDRRALEAERGSGKRDLLGSDLLEPSLNPSSNARLSRLSAFAPGCGARLGSRK